ncbi:hypothetical protein [Paraliobacillus zengyii]|uniref:hypothetical protein n=1 Tax=Paraliobacillus zengyii TaxID=2213194 RepID=UPI000E3DE954|nr:hypothetical protein [Paraliobacillus zengyii]
MKINLMIFVSSIKKEKNTSKVLIKTFESTIRPVQGDILDDPGFHPGFHNGYEVVKVTLNYSTDECLVSLHPLVLEKEDIKIEAYIDRLEEHGWRVVPKEDLKH